MNRNYELEFRYYDRDSSYKYFNRKFEVFLLEKKSLKKRYVLHMDNSDQSQMMPLFYMASSTGHPQRCDVGISTLNWNDIKNNFVDCIAGKIGEQERENARKAVGKLHSPKV